MERLTQKYESGAWGIRGSIDDAVMRLIAYENTGLAPEEIKSLQAEYAVNLKVLESYRSMGSVDRLRELAQADKEGRCVVLDVKIGQKVWILDAGEYGDDDEAYPLELNINGITLSDEHEIYYFIESPLGMDIDPFSHKDIGKTVFLTREEAEAALRREQNG